MLEPMLVLYTFTNNIDWPCKFFFLQWLVKILVYINSHQFFRRNKTKSKIW